SLLFPIQFLHHREPQLDSGMLHFLVIGRTQVLSFGFILLYEHLMLDISHADLYSIVPFP
ncbi:Hypothetical predicted protein, partial [Olea europaea subsp. europaea]